MWIVLRSLTGQPIDHGGSPRQYLPAAARSAKTKRAGRIDDMVSNLGVRLIDASIKPPVDDDAASNTRAHGHTNHAALTLGRSQEPFSQCDRVCVVLHCDGNLE